MVAQEPLKLVSSAPQQEMVEDLARKLNCSLEEASTVLSPLRPTTPKEEPLLPGLLPESETLAARSRPRLGQAQSGQVRP